MESSRRGFISRTFRWGAGVLTLMLGDAAMKLGYNLAEGMSLPYEVSIACRFHSVNYNQFAGERSSFEKTDVIGRLNEEYMKEGRILDYRFSKSDQGVEWKYIFRSKADYKAWNKFVYHGGLFSRSKLKKNYEIQISKRYLVPSDLSETFQRRLT